MTKRRVMVVNVLSACLALGLSACGDSADSGTPANNEASTSPGSSGSTGSATSTSGGSPEPSECGNLTHEEAVQIASTNLEFVLQTSSNSLAFIENSLVLPRALNGSADPLEYKADFDQSITDLIRDLENRIMHVDNVSELSNVGELGGATVLYDLQPEVFCEQPEPNPDDPIAEEDALADYDDCLNSLMETPLGFEVTRVDCDAGDSVRISVLVGEERHNPLTLLLGPAQLSAEIDLENLVSVLEAHGDLDENTTISPDTSGRLRAQLSRTDASSAALTLSIDAPIHWSSTTEGVDTNIELDQTGQIVSLQTSLSDESITGQLTLGRLDYSMPFDSFVDSFFQREVAEPGSEPVWMSIAGLNSNLNYTGANDTLELTGLGLGSSASTATYQGNTLLRIDVNQDSARTLDVVATSSASEPLRLGITPGFDLDIEYALAPVASQVIELQSFAADDSVSIALSGDAPVVVLSEDIDGYVSLLDDVSGTLLSVQSGTLGFSSRVLPDDNVSVGTGQCLERLATPAGNHEFLAELAAQACP